MDRNPEHFEGRAVRHFKGNLYVCIGVAKDTEEDKYKMVYRALYGAGALHIRDLNMFMSKVDRVKYPDVDQEFRFELLE